MSLKYQIAVKVFLYIRAMEDLIDTDEILVYLAKRLNSREAIYELSDKESEQNQAAEAA